MRDVCLIRNEMNRTALTNLRVLLVDRSGLLGVGVGVGVVCVRVCVCVGVRVRAYVHRQQHHGWLEDVVSPSGPQNT